MLAFALEAGSGNKSTDVRENVHDLLVGQSQFTAEYVQSSWSSPPGCAPVQAIQQARARRGSVLPSDTTPYRSLRLWSSIQYLFGEDIPEPGSSLKHTLHTPKRGIFGLW